MLEVHLFTTNGCILSDEEGFRETSISVKVGSVVSTTKAKHRKSDYPIWDKKLRFTVSDPKNISLLVQLLDDTNGKRVIGEVTIPFRSPIEGIEEIRWHSFQNGQGDVKIGLTYKSHAEPLAPPLSPRVQPQSAPAAPVVAPSGTPAGHPPVTQAGHPPVTQAGHPPVTQAGHPPVTQAGHPPVTQAGPPPATPAMLVPFAPGDLQRELPPFAKGSYGVIYRGQARGIPKTVVIKDMEIKDARSIEDWKKEVNCMSMHRSPYIVEIFGYSSFGNVLAVVMEYMTKGDLYTMLHKKSHYQQSLSILQRVRMARHVALGVNFLHKNNILHRDIKSMNVLVNDEYTCKLTDFGCAKLVSSNQYLNTMNAGTPMWMAPEVKSGAYGLPADVYSLGLVLYELFEKNLPVWDQNRQCIVLPGSFQSASVVLPCLNIVPHLRPSADEVCKVLDKIIRNMLLSVKDTLPASHQEKIKQVAGNDDVELYLHHMYRHLLLNMNAVEVDDLINRSFQLPAQASKNYRSNNPVPLQPPVQQLHYSSAPASVPFGFPIAPTRHHIPTGVPMGYPQYPPANYGAPSLQPPPTHM